MNIFQPIKLTVVTPSAEVPILSNHKKRFYTYIPSAMVFLTMRYADELSDTDIRRMDIAG